MQNKEQQSKMFRLASAIFIAIFLGYLYFSDTKEMLPADNLPSVTSETAQHNSEQVKELSAGLLQLAREYCLLAESSITGIEAMAALEQAGASGNVPGFNRKKQELEQRLSVASNYLEATLQDPSKGCDSFISTPYTPQQR